LNWITYNHRRFCIRYSHSWHFCLRRIFRSRPLQLTTGNSFYSGISLFPDRFCQRPISQSIVMFRGEFKNSANSKIFLSTYLVILSASARIIIFLGLPLLLRYCNYLNNYSNIKILLIRWIDFQIFFYQRASLIYNNIIYYIIVKKVISYFSLYN